MVTKNSRIELCLYIILAVVYIGSWFPAMVIYSRLTFNASGTYVQSFAILFCSIFPPLILGDVVARLLGTVGAFTCAVFGLLLEGASSLALLHISNSIGILVIVALGSLGVSVVQPMRAVVTRECFKDGYRRLVIARCARLRAVATLAAPPTAAFTVALISEQNSLIAYATCCAFCIVPVWILSSVSANNLASRNKATGSILNQFLQRRYIFFVMVGAVFVVITFDLVYPLFIRDHGLGGIISFSSLLTAYGAGAFLSTFTPFLQRHRSWSLFACFLVPLGLLIPTANATVAIVALSVVAALTGLFNTALNISLNIELQESEDFTTDTAVAAGMTSSAGQLLAIALMSLLFVGGDNYHLVVILTFGVIATLCVAESLRNQKPVKRGSGDEN